MNLDDSFLSNLEPGSIENLYRQYLADKDSVDTSWKLFFEGFELSKSHFSVLPEDENTKVSTSDSFQEFSEILGPEAGKLDKEFKVFRLIEAYRTRGHLFTRTNPVRERRQYKPTLDHKNFGLDDSDLEEVFQGGEMVGIGPAKLKDIIADLKSTFCENIGCEYKFIRKPVLLDWIESRMHKTKNCPKFSREEKLAILDSLNRAVSFESFLQSRFVGQKRFSMEGVEACIPALNTVVEVGAKKGIREFVIGMAHRGRLNILSNVMNKSFEFIFSEFEGKGYGEDSQFAGDVKYHMGFSSDYETKSTGAKVHLSMPPNPSHLEAVNPVVEGVVRAKIDKRYDNDHSKIAPILIHGDSSIAGQGVLYELIQMSDLDGYRTGGTIHIVLNNQIGFTTNYLEARTSTYCTDIAKIAKSPVIHVNGDNAEAVVFAVLFALDFRQEFHQDVFIDILGYRKYGHNEGDDPRFTQPALYKTIAGHPNPYQIYCKKLIEEGVIEASDEQRLSKEFRDSLDKELEKARNRSNTPMNSFLQGDWKGIRLAKKNDLQEHPITGVPLERIKNISEKAFILPENRDFYPKIRKIYSDRLKMVMEKEMVDWAIAESLAYATLLDQSYSVRISGQDCRRGTFSHRHALVRSEDEKEDYFPLDHISKNQGDFLIYNSILSEYGVLGFEYGYAMANPKTLTIWEAQFGDFANGAQIIIDQFIASAESKWLKMNGIALFLPHGYEGQGPEHSSARIERFLNLCGEDNMIVANCSTPANLFHILRKQLLVPFRKPLILFTPKSLLRHPGCVSDLTDLAENTRFNNVIDDPSIRDKKSIQRVLVCSGKIYYDLQEYQTKNRRDDVAIVRLEQIHPVPEKDLSETIASYTESKETFWVQEEPQNQGPWQFIFMNFFKDRMPIQVCSREAGSSTAIGFAKLHLQEQNEIVRKAFHF